MIRIVVLGSTKGTDLQCVIDAIEAKKLNAEIVLVLSNKKDAFILERAKKHKLKAIFVDPAQIKPREFYDSKLIQLIEKEKPDLILLIGWMRILSEKFCNQFKNKIMNIHPSLLPEFAGGRDSNVHEEVIKAGKKETGCTLHFVTAKVDEGPIIMQKKVSVEENETPDSLKEKVQKAEQEVILNAVDLFEKGKIKVTEGKVIIEE
ncbi:MAG: phosphoribosylglycinamide formyltransferase [Candidatus Diapherotrites archaeon]|nr:phosphoribosylglycinamide formyltransferase [Candidatus Diapherotrites archaeon]